MRADVQTERPDPLADLRRGQTHRRRARPHRVDQISGQVTHLRADEDGSPGGLLQHGVGIAQDGADPHYSVSVSTARNVASTPISAATAPISRSRSPGSTAAGTASSATIAYTGDSSPTRRHVRSVMLTSRPASVAVSRATRPGLSDPYAASVCVDGAEGTRSDEVPFTFTDILIALSSVSSRRSSSAPSTPSGAS